MKRAALYLRSSKDRKDVSPDSQRRILTDLARQKNYTVVAEFVDVEERADDARRSGYLAMMAAIAERNRGWSALLVHDTGRIARRDDLLAATFKHVCRRQGIEVIFYTMPAVNPIMDLMAYNTSRTYDQLHSIMSREKGLAGMAENVRQGFRAGGRAPIGYDLVPLETGAIRGGKPVTKSRLAPNRQAPAIGAYLAGRAAGTSSTKLLRRLGLTLRPASAVGVEWNALTYAGHTVWNRHSERSADGYSTGKKRRPRAVWLIQRVTHPAVITDEQAEAILARLERGRGRYRTRSDYLLSGLLVSMQGKPWHGDRDGDVLYYRCGKRRVKAETIDSGIRERIARDFQTDAFAERTITNTQRALERMGDGRELAQLNRDVADRDRRIARLTNLLEETTMPAPLLRKIEELEIDRGMLLQRQSTARDKAEYARVARRVTDGQVRELLRRLREDIGRLDQTDLKDWLRGIVTRIELDPESLSCRIRYAFKVAPAVTLPSATGELVASPRRVVEIPHAEVVSSIRFRRRWWYLAKPPKAA